MRQQAPMALARLYKMHFFRVYENRISGNTGRNDYDSCSFSVGKPRPFGLNAARDLRHAPSQDNSVYVVQGRALPSRPDHPVGVYAKPLDDVDQEVQTVYSASPHRHNLIMWHFGG
jgi:hypothetical protein